MDHESLTARKQAIRTIVRERRNQQQHKPALSRQIFERCVGLPEFLHAHTVALYLATPSEVQTQALIEECWRREKQVAVPCCFGNELRLFHLESMQDLTPRTMGILEPREEFHALDKRWLSASQIDLFIVPGIAFDRSGGRLGYGKGYYDRLLAQARQTVPRMGLAFECQLTSEVPVNTYDILMEIVVTNQSVYRPE